MATSQDDVEYFLKDFNIKLSIWGILFRDERGTNFQALLDLGITSDFRTEVIKDIKVEDYSEGPVIDTLYKLSDMWIFGKLVKNQEIYIKISLGSENLKVICISFHIAQSTMNYPFKK